MYMHSI